jgi:UDP-glucose 4-epimerase
MLEETEIIHEKTMTQKIKQRAVIIGGAGFIGLYTVKELMKEGYSVLVIDNLSTGSKELIPPGVEFLELDIRNYDDILPVIKESDIIFHLADRKGTEIALDANEINLRGTYNVLEVARIQKAFGVILASSSAVYGNHEGHALETVRTEPVTLYGTHKLMSEQIARTYTTLFGIPTVSLRYFSVYGKGQHDTSSEEATIAKLLQQKKETKYMSLTGKGLSTKDFIHVTDIARANVLAIDILENKDYECFNICTGKNTTLKEVAEYFGGPIEYTDVYKIPVHIFGDTVKAQNILHFEAKVHLKEGLTLLA